MRQRSPTFAERLRELPATLPEALEPDAANFPQALSDDQCFFITNKVNVYMILLDSARAYEAECQGLFGQRGKEGEIRGLEFLDKITKFKDAPDGILFRRFAEICCFYSHESKKDLFKNSRLLFHIAKAIVKIGNRYYPFNLRDPMTAITIDYQQRQNQFYGFARLAHQASLRRKKKEEQLNIIRAAAKDFLILNPRYEKSEDEILQKQVDDNMRAPRLR